MEKRVMNQEMMKKLALIKNNKKPSVTIIDSLYAQMILEYSLFVFQKEQILYDIDITLEEGNQERFMKLTTIYNELIDKYKSEKCFSEQGYELKMTFIQ